MPERIAYAREPRKLPVVLGAEEVMRFLKVVTGLKSRARRIRQRLVRPYRIDRSLGIAYLAGCRKDGRTFYVDHY